MLNAPNGMPHRCDRTLGIQKMPEGYELWCDEDGYFWWHQTATQREGGHCYDKWVTRREAIFDSNTKQ